jgi:hypothetical protein
MDSLQGFWLFGFLDSPTGSADAVVGVDVNDIESVDCRLSNIDALANLRVCNSQKMNGVIAFRYLIQSRHY